jgi:hypothetical protein
MYSHTGGLFCARAKSYFALENTNEIVGISARVKNA